MNSLTAITLMIVVEALGFMYYASRSRFALQGFAAINMLLSLLLTSKVGAFGSGFTSLTSVWYTAVLAAQVHIKLFHGRRATVDSAVMMMSTSALFTALILCTAFVPTVPGNEFAAEALQRWSDRAQYTVPAAFMGYAVSQTIVLAVIGHARMLPRVSALLAMVLAQVADSFIYFPAAFRSLDVARLTEVMMSGFQLKMYATMFLWGAAVVDWQRVFVKTHERAKYAVSTASSGGTVAQG